MATTLNKGLKRELASWDGLDFVPVKTASMAQRQTFDADQRGARLPRYALEGSVLRHNETVTIQARLFDARTGGMFGPLSYTRTRRIVRRSLLSSRLASQAHLTTNSRDSHRPLDSARKRLDVKRACFERTLGGTSTFRFFPLTKAPDDSNFRVTSNV